MPLLSKYQNEVIADLSKYDFSRIFQFKGRCHEALIGEWINWWFNQKNEHLMICNPARQSKQGPRKFIADILFLERFQGDSHYQVKGVAEIENSADKIFDKIKSLSSYEKYTVRGYNVYPDLKFAVLCYTMDHENPLREKIIQKIYLTSQSSNLLWITCTIYKRIKDDPEYLIHMPEYVKDADYFYYRKNFESVNIRYIKNGKTHNI